MKKNWLLIAKEYLAEHDIPSLICCSGESTFDDLLFFELEERTCFVQINATQANHYHFGCFEVVRDSGGTIIKTCLGWNYVGLFTKDSLERAIQSQLAWDQEFRENHGGIFHISSGTKISLNKIKTELIQDNGNGQAILIFKNGI